MEAWGGHHPAASPCMSVTPPQLCVVLNDVELLRKAAGQALRGLAWPEGAAGLEGTLPRPLLSCTQALDEDLQREARTVTAHLTSKVAGPVGWGRSQLPLPAPALLSTTLLLSHRWWVTSGSMCSTSASRRTPSRMTR